MGYPLHPNKLTHFKKNDTGILFRNNLKAILMDSSINIESILNEAILESNKLLQSETVSKNNRVISKGNYIDIRRGYTVTGLNLGPGCYECING